MKFYGLVAVMVILIILIIWYRHNDEVAIAGVWIGDPDFCAQSGATQIMLYIEPPSTLMHTLDGYLIIMDGIANTPFTARYSPDILRRPGHVEYTVSISDDIPWPDTLVFSMDVTRGRLRIHDGATLYALLYKDPMLSCEKD